jgi:hypothetical protein
LNVSEQLKNFAATTLAGDINSSVTSISVADGSVFPATGNFRLLCGTELILCTDRTGNVLTVTRAAESTGATAHSSGDAITLVLTAASLLQAIADNASGGAVSSVAGRTGAVTLSNTDISGLGTAATHAASDFDTAGSAALKLSIASNLSDLNNVATARTNLGLGTAATQAATAFDASGAAASVNSTLGTHTARTDNPHSTTKAQVGLGSVLNAVQLQATNNLSDLASVATAITHLFPAYIMYDADSAASLNWDSRILYDASGNTSVDWQNGQIHNPIYGVVFDWYSGFARSIFSEDGVTTPTVDDTNINSIVQIIMEMLAGFKMLQFSNS